MPSTPKLLDSTPEEQSALLCDLTTYADGLDEADKVSILMFEDVCHDLDYAGSLRTAVLLSAIGVLNFEGLITVLHHPELRKKFADSYLQSLGAGHVRTASGLKEMELREKKPGEAPSYHVKTAEPYEAPTMNDFVSKHPIDGSESDVSYLELAEDFLKNAKNPVIIQNAGFETTASIFKRYSGLIEKLKMFVSQGGTAWEEGKLVPDWLGSNNQFAPTATKAVLSALQKADKPTESCIKTTAFVPIITEQDYVDFQKSGHPAGTMERKLAPKLNERYYANACDPKTVIGGRDWKFFLEHRTDFSREAYTESEHRAFARRKAAGETTPSEEAEREKEMQRVNSAIKKHLTSQSTPPTFTEDSLFEGYSTSIANHCQYPQYDTWSVPLAEPRFADFIGIFSDDENALNKWDGENGIHHSRGTYESTDGQGNTIPGRGGIDKDKAQLFFRTIMNTSLLAANSYAKADAERKTVETYDAPGGYTHTITNTDGKWGLQVTRAGA